MVGPNKHAQAGYLTHTFYHTALLTGGCLHNTVALVMRVGRPIHTACYTHTLTLFSPICVCLCCIYCCSGSACIVSLLLVFAFRALLRTGSVLDRALQAFLGGRSPRSGPRRFNIHCNTFILPARHTFYSVHHTHTFFLCMARLFRDSDRSERYFSPAVADLSLLRI